MRRLGWQVGSAKVGWEGVCSHLHARQLKDERTQQRARNPISSHDSHEKRFPSLFLPLRDATKPRASFIHSSDIYTYYAARATPMTGLGGLVLGQSRAGQKRG